MNVYQERKKFISYVVLAVGIIFFLRLFYLQVYTGKYKIFAKENALQKRIIYPARGIIFDRNNEILASNEAVYDLMITPYQVDKNIDKAGLISILNISDQEYDSIYQVACAYSMRKPSIFLKNISVKTYGLLQECMYKYHGFYVQPRTMRKYPRETAAHLLGYVGEVTPEDIEKSEGYYHRGDMIGVSGLEKSYENWLRGVTGEKYVLVDVHNTEQGSYMKGNLDKPARTGTNLITGIDIEIQTYAEKLMKGKKGAVVAIQPSTGEIMAMVSAPTYTPSMLQGRERAKNYLRLKHDKDKPLFNRAINAMYPPGSSFKTVMSLIGLKENVITLSSTHSCNGGYVLGNLRIGCHPHPSPVDVHFAIVYSCNAYYCQVFRDVIDQKKFTSIYEGFNNWRNTLTEFGIGTLTGIDLPGESKGILPTTARYDKIYGKRRWKSSNILSLAIGQAEISLTPLQMANVAAIIANRGYYITPHVVNAFEIDNLKRKIKYDRHSINILPEYFNKIADAMMDVPIKGTAIRYGPYFKDYEICGKTGTAQNPHGKEHSVFICFAPKNNPRIAVAAVVENAGQGAHWAAPICFLIIERYFIRKENEKTKWIEEIMLGNTTISIDKEKNHDEQNEDSELTD